MRRASNYLAGARDCLPNHASGARPLDVCASQRRCGTRAFTVRKTVDVMIATFCIVNHQVLLHADRDFERMRAPLGPVPL